MRKTIEPEYAKAKSRLRGQFRLTRVRNKRAPCIPYEPTPDPKEGSKALA